MIAMTDAQPSLIVERHEGWAALVLNRPQRRNAFTAELMERLADALAELSADPAIAAIALRGADGAFCSGVDLTDLKERAATGGAQALQQAARRAHLALFHCPCPIVVALERYAINGGSGLAVAGDLIVAGEGAFLQIGEIQQGVHIPMNAAWLRLKTSETVLARLAFLGDRVGAAELLRLGVVHEVVADAQVRERAEAIAQRIAGFPAGSSRRIKSDLRARCTIDPQTWFAQPGGASLLGAAQVRA